MSRRLKILLGLGIALVVAILSPVIHHYQLRAATEAYIAQLKARGEPMELAQVIPSPVPPEQNAVPFITNALTNLKYDSIAVTNSPPALRMISPGKALIGWRQPGIIGRQATNTWEDLGRELVTAKNDIESFQSLTNHPALDFGLDYSKGFDLRLTYLSSLKFSAQWLSAAAMYNLHKGDPKSACTDVHTILAMAKGESDEPILISQLVRIAITAIGINATWEVLQDPNVSDEDLAQLQLDWQSLDFVKPLKQALMFERVEDLQECAQTRASSEKFKELWGYYYVVDQSTLSGSEYWGQTKRSLWLQKFDELRWRWFWSYEDQIYGLKSSQVVIEATRMAETNSPFNAVEPFAKSRIVPLDEKHSVNPMNGLREAFSGDSHFAAVRKAIQMEAARNVVTSAIVLKRYELRNHRLPDKLNELVPEYLKSVPIDCMDGQPLRYRQNADGTFLLYSVGPNGKDDGGNPAEGKDFAAMNIHNWLDLFVLDWIWPQPATEAEIKAYYDRQKSGN